MFCNANWQKVGAPLCGPVSVRYIAASVLHLLCRPCKRRDLCMSARGSLLHRHRFSWCRSGSYYCWAMASPQSQPNPVPILNRVLRIPLEGQPGLSSYRLLPVTTQNQHDAPSFLGLWDFTTKPEFTIPIPLITYFGTYIGQASTLCPDQTGAPDSNTGNSFYT